MNLFLSSHLHFIFRKRETDKPDFKSSPYQNQTKGYTLRFLDNDATFANLSNYSKL